MNNCNKLVLGIFLFMAVTTRCENWDGIEYTYASISYHHPRCVEETKIFETKEKLVDFLKQQDNLTSPHAKAYEVNPLPYDLVVETEKEKRTVEMYIDVETKREIIFK